MRARGACSRFNSRALRLLAPRNIGPARSLVRLGYLQVKPMQTEERRRTISRELGLAGALIAAGLLMSGIALFELVAQPRQAVAQSTPGTPPLQGTPSPGDSKPAEAKPGGTRPTTPAPEPARPDPSAQTEATKPALPPAPAEKVAPPINPPAKEK